MLNLTCWTLASVLVPYYFGSILVLITGLPGSGTGARAPCAGLYPQ